MQVTKRMKMQSIYVFAWEEGGEKKIVDGTKKILD